nr:Tn3 family transposase [Streptomyces sp. NBC_00974]
MRREWEPEDLIEVWTLLEEDQDRLRNTSGANRLGFALLLKFFEVEARFPEDAAEVPAATWAQRKPSRPCAGSPAEVPSAPPTAPSRNWGGPYAPPSSATTSPDANLRREIGEGLQVVENWNSANHDLFYGKDGELTGKDKEGQEISMLALHLLQSALVHVNTLLVQEVLAEPKRADQHTEADRRGLSPLFWTHVNPYGRFELDMDRHLHLGPLLPRQRTPQDDAASSDTAPVG